MNFFWYWRVPYQIPICPLYDGASVNIIVVNDFILAVGKWLHTSHTVILLYLSDLDENGWISLYSDSCQCRYNAAWIQFKTKKWVGKFTGQMNHHIVLNITIISSEYEAKPDALALH